jgi:hypothetical protein
MLSRSSLPAPERKLYSALKELLDQPGLLRGNLVVMRRKCGKAACRCAQDPDQRHVSLYLSLSHEGKRRMVYIPADWEERVREWVDRYAQVRDALGKLSQACLKRLESREE